MVCFEGSYGQVGTMFARYTVSKGLTLNLLVRLFTIWSQFVIRKCALLVLLALIPCLSVAQSLDTSSVSDSGDDLSAAQIINEPIDYVPPPTSGLEAFWCESVQWRF